MRVFIVSLLFFILLISCEKDSISYDLSESFDRATEFRADLRNYLHDPEQGWVMMLESNQNSQIGIPLVLKFDTLKNTVAMISPYGFTDASTLHFTHSTGTGSEILTFSTSSLVTSFFRLGLAASDITDHIFKVMSLSSDTITLQGYRSGGVYSPEGGKIFKLFKRPAQWTWADDDVYFDLNTVAGRFPYFNKVSRLRVYQGADLHADLSILLQTLGAADINLIRSYHPFTNISARGFQPIYPFFFNFLENFPNPMNSTLAVIPNAGYNALSFYYYPTFTQTGVNIINLRNRLGTYYLIVESVEEVDNQIHVQLLSYNLEGNVILTALWELPLD